jgi:hypothetical protein
MGEVEEKPVFFFDIDNCVCRDRSFMAACERLADSDSSSIRKVCAQVMDVTI